MLLTLPYESCVGVKPVLLGWRPTYEMVEDPYPGPGISCYGDHDELSFEYHHKWHKRLMYKCPGIEQNICDFYFLTRKGLLEHEHGFI